MDIFDFIDKVVYINLEHRTDRNEHMKKATNVFGDKVIRFEAIKSSPGYIGCSRSHISVIEMAIANNWKNVLVLEDDSEWNENSDAYESFRKLSKIEFDVLVLGGFGPKFNDITHRLYHTHGTHAYIVRNHYFHVLLDNFRTGLALLENEDNRGFLDVYWNKLIQKDEWFIAIPNLIYQLDGYSDIDCNFRNIMNWSVLSLNTPSEYPWWVLDERIDS